MANIFFDVSNDGGHDIPNPWIKQKYKFDIKGKIMLNRIIIGLIYVLQEKYRIPTIYVDSKKDKNTNHGLSIDHPVKTVERALELSTSIIVRRS